MAKEKRSDGVSPVTVLLGVAVAIAALAYLAMPRHTHHASASNESCAVATLRMYLGAQNTFHRKDYYGKGELVFANPKDGAGFPDLYQVGHGVAPRGEALKLIDIATANAKPGGTPKAGYCFADITSGPEGPCDFAIECGLCAVPAKYNRTGRNIFIVDVTGTVYQADAALIYPDLRRGDAVPPVTTYPGAAELAKWIPVGSD